MFKLFLIICLIQIIKQKVDDISVDVDGLVSMTSRTNNCTTLPY